MPMRQPVIHNDKGRMLGRIARCHIAYYLDFDNCLLLF